MPVSLESTRRISLCKAADPFLGEALRPEGGLPGDVKTVTRSASSPPLPTGRKTGHPADLPVNRGLRCLNLRIICGMHHDDLPSHGKLPAQRAALPGNDLSLNCRAETRAVYLENGIKLDNLHDSNHSSQAFFHVQ